MEAQEIFDTVATHLFKQGRQATSRQAGGLCVYRGEGGLKCAVGVLIPDQLYTETMEGSTFFGLADEAEWGLPEWMADNRSLLWDLQGAHDVTRNWESSAAMKRALNKVAAKSGLASDVLDELAFPWESKEAV